MQVRDPLAARPFVQVVDVLGHDVQVDAPLGGPGGVLPLSDGHVAGVGSCLLADMPAPEVPGVHGVGVLGPGVQGGHVLRVDALPDAGLRVAEGVQPRVLAHSRAGEDDDVPRARQDVSQFLR